ncbi:MAG: class I SAM-dependent methyltransferase [Deltaproteobacteria bacterium]|nr:class I SAM-dependent methyltransferase [Deltaproteobacteria bacterium]
MADISEAGAETKGNLKLVQQQFRRQAEAYEAIPIVTDEQFLNYIVTISGVGKNDRVLDVASGPGFVAMAFAPHCREVIGIDATDRFVARAEAEASRRRLTNVSFMLGDVERMSFPDQTFDVVVCRFAFHHFPHPDAVLAEIRRVVRDGGTVMIVDMVASEDTEKAAYHNRVERLCDPSHARALPATEFERMFAAQRLDVLHKEPRKSSYTLDAWIAHGAPAPTQEAQIRELMAASVAEDRSGLDVRVMDGVIGFSHTGMSYVLRKRG